MARQVWGCTYLAYVVFDIFLLASTESLIGGISSACHFVTGACSLAAFWRERRDMLENGARRRCKAVATLRSAAGLSSI